VYALIFAALAQRKESQMQRLNHDRAPSLLRHCSIACTVRILARAMLVALVFCAVACSKGSSGPKAESPRTDGPSAPSETESVEQSAPSFHADPWSTTKTTQNRAADRIAGADGEAEAVLMEFLVALLGKDAETVKRTSVPHPELSILWETQDAAPPDVLAEIKAFLDGQLIRLRVGDRVKLPSGRYLAVDEGAIDDNRVILLATFPGEESVPFTLSKSQGVWRVDTTPLIAARKAVVAAKERDENSNKLR
jgi:hypothetical protein